MYFYFKLKYFVFFDTTYFVPPPMLQYSCFTYFILSDLWLKYYVLLKIHYVCMFLWSYVWHRIYTNKNPLKKIKMGVKMKKKIHKKRSTSYSHLTMMMMLMMMMVVGLFERRFFCCSPVYSWSWWIMRWAYKGWVDIQFFIIFLMISFYFFFAHQIFTQTYDARYWMGVCVCVCTRSIEINFEDEMMMWW